MRNLHLRYKIAAVLAGRGAVNQMAIALDVHPERLARACRNHDEILAGKKRKGQHRSLRIEVLMEAFIREQFKKHAGVFDLEDR